MDHIFLGFFYRFFDRGEDVFAFTQAYAHTTFFVAYNYQNRKTKLVAALGLLDTRETCTTFSSYFFSSAFAS